MDKEKRLIRLIDLALEYKKQYKECAWWRFRKKKELYDKWNSTLDLIIKNFK